MTVGPNWSKPTTSWGVGVTETTEWLRGEYGPKLNVSCIGLAGENRVRYAAIMNDIHRALGRCGLGAVMGSKGLKAVAEAAPDPSKWPTKRPSRKQPKPQATS